MQSGLTVAWRRQACTLLVPGSHAWTSTQRANWEDFVDPADVVSVRVPPGSIMIWRNCKPARHNT